MSSPVSVKDPDPAPASGLPPELRFLKWLVTTLTVVMILGVIAVVGLLVTRLQSPLAELPSLPASVSLPEGVVPASLAFTRNRVVVLSEDDRVFVFDSASGALLGGMALVRP